MSRTRSLAPTPLPAGAATAPEPSASTATRPLVSIVLITMNRAGLLPRCLASLVAQTWRPLQLVVVDDGSRDDTPAVLAAWREQAPNGVSFEVHRHPHNRGIGAARNTGIAAARGKRIAFTDDDCVADPDWIRHLVAPFAADPSLAVVGGGIDEPADRTWAQRASEGINFLGNRRRQVRSIVGCNMAWQKSFLRQHPFDEGATAYADELDRCLDARAAGRSVLFTPDARVTHHHRQSIRGFLRQQYKRGAGSVWVRHKHGLDLWPKKHWVTAALLLSPLGFLALPPATAALLPLGGAVLFVAQTLLLDRLHGKRIADSLRTLPLVLLGYVVEFAGAMQACLRGRRQ